MHLFYAKAFETLFHKHDALKEQYDRARKSGLQVDEFEKVFAIFCLKTYVLEKTEFTKTEILGFINDALTYNELNIKSDEYLFDIEEAVCLAMREGSSYFFVHRSFQEYFTALFLSICPEDVRDEFIDKVSSRYWDNVLPMLFDMASDQIEPSWVVRNIDKYLNDVSDTDPNKITPLEARFTGMGFQKHGNSVYFGTTLAGPYTKFTSIMRRFYPSLSKTNAAINLDKIEKFAADNWDSLLPETEINHKLSDGNTISIKNVIFSKIPESLTEEAGLVALANEEYQQIIEIRSNVDLIPRSDDRDSEGVAPGGSV